MKEYRCDLERLLEVHNRLEVAFHTMEYDLRPTFRKARDYNNERIRQYLAENPICYDCYTVMERCPKKQQG